MKAIIYSIFTIVLLAFLPSCGTDTANTNVSADTDSKPTLSDPNLNKAKLPKALTAKLNAMKQNPKDHNRNAQTINEIAQHYVEHKQTKKAIDILKTGAIFHDKGNMHNKNLVLLAETLKGDEAFKQDYINYIQSLQIGTPTMEGLSTYASDVPSTEPKIAKKIENIQNNLTVSSTGRLDLDKVNEFVNIVELFVIANPSNEKSPAYLKLAAEVVNSVKVYPRAIQFYDWILTRFPNSQQAAQALFMKGFTLDDGMKNKQAAKPVYEEFLKKYPKNDFADDTQFLLKNISKTDEEIIKQFDDKK